MAIYRHVVTGPGAAGDIWSVRIHSHSAVPNLGAAHAAWETALSTMFGAGGVADWWPDLTGSSEAVTYIIGPGSANATAVTRSAAVHMGNGGAAQLGPRDCVVVGLRTTLPGAGGRGRIFLPAVSADNLTTTGLISTAAKTGIANAVGAALVTMQSDGYLPGIWALSDGTSIRAFNSCTVGSVLGVQRRRSNKIPNSYVTAAA